MKHGISLPNTPATIDADYRGEIRVPLINLGRESFRVSRGMRIAQLVVAPVVRVTWDEVDVLPATDARRKRLRVTRASDILFARHMPDDSRAGRDSETRAVQGGGGVRPRQGAAVRAAVVGGGVSGARRREGCGRSAGVPAQPTSSRCCGSSICCWSKG